MDIRLEKLELIKLLLNTEEEYILKKIKDIFQEENIQISEEQLKVVAERREEYLNGEGQYFSYEEVKKRIKDKTL